MPNPETSRNSELCDICHNVFISFLIQFEVEMLLLVDKSILTDRLGDEISCLIGFHKWRQTFVSQDSYLLIGHLYQKFRT